MSAHEFSTEIDAEMLGELGELLGELDAKISFDYSPSEPMEPNPDHHLFGPGCAEVFDLTALEVSINGKWVEVLHLVPEHPNQYAVEIEDKCREFFNAGDEE